MKRRGKGWIAFFLAAALGVLGGVVLAMFFQITQVTDNSMMPGFEQGQHVLVQSSVGSFDAERGDVVLFDNQVYAATGESGHMMKRVIGTGGDRVMITGGRVYVNNVPLEEDYVFRQGHQRRDG